MHRRRVRPRVACPRRAARLVTVPRVQPHDRAQLGLLPHDVSLQDGVLLPVSRAVEDVRVPAVGRAQALCGCRGAGGWAET